MKLSMIGLAWAGALTLTLAACASGASTTSTGGSAASAAKPNIVVRQATAEEEAKIPAGYTLIKRDGVDFYCHTESVLGSHSQKKQVCQTQAQIDAERNRATKSVDYTNSR